MQINTYQLAATLKRYRDRTGQRQRNLYKINQGDLFAVDTPERVRKFFLRRGLAGAAVDKMIAGAPQPRLAASESFGMREPDALERVIGTSDLMGVAFLERGLTVSRTVARIWVDFSAGSAMGYGTGFMISPRLLITNHHVLQDAATAQASKAEFNYQLGADGNPVPSALFSLRPGDFFVTSQELDYAVVAVAALAEATALGSGRALTDFGFNAMIEEEGKAIAAQWLNIIQHPEGGYKQLALRENQLVDVSDQFLTYQTDTAPGSSGSPVYNDRWEVVGLHHSGVPARDAQGNILALDGSRWTSEMGEDKVKWVSNEGVRISQVIADLRAKAGGADRAKYLDEMLAAAPVPVMPQGETASNPPTSTTGRSTAGVPNPAAPTASATGPVLRGGVATWTIPLTVSVALPDFAGAGGGATIGGIGPASSAPGGGGGSGGGSGDADDFESILGQAKASLGARPDVLSVTAGYVFKDGWITRQQAVVVKVGKRATPSELRESGVAPLPGTFKGVPVEVVNPTIDDLFATQAKAAPAELFRQATVATEEILYHPPADAKLNTVEAKMKVTASVSPDHGWPLLQQFLAGTRQRLVVGMYDFGAPHIRDAVTQMGEGPTFQKMTLAIQAGSDEGSGTKADDLPDDKMVAALQAALGDKFESTWVKVGIKNGWVATSYHIKVAVRDSAAFWLSSGNWQSSNQPEADPLSEQPPSRTWLTKYNREWHVVVEHTGLAKTFETYIENDFTANEALATPEIAMPDILVPGAMLLPALEERAAPFQYFAPFDAERVFTVQPLLTPDNYAQALLKLVNKAEQSLLIQNQTFNAATDKQTDLATLLDAVIAKQNAGLDVRVIFRIIDSSKARENLQALQDRGFDMRRVKVQRNCHTKGVIVDGKRVMIGSQNISQLGITLNRDASLLFKDRALAAYFTTIFEHDWANLAKQDIGNEAHAPELATGAVTPRGMERISWKDYMEMA
ncbi:MAG TPA: trypsin-like peptidase domain-containing protein [Dongiaceae bacterium]|nr:trypsin-like peptidase domain-containing protein [Dongiaceae bacterium]